MRDRIPRAMLSGAAAAVSYYDAVSGVAATFVVRGLKIPRLGYFEDFGGVPAESAPQSAPAAFADLNEISGFEIKIKKSQRSARLGFLGVTVRFAAVESVCQIHS